jgi:hypothetical protein
MAGCMRIYETRQGEGQIRWGSNQLGHRREKGEGIEREGVAHPLPGDPLVFLGCTGPERLAQRQWRP